MTVTQYVVLNDNALGYINDVQPGVVGILAGKVSLGGPSPIDGPVYAAPGNKVRPATTNDFDYFRVAVPPDFRA